MLIPDNEFEFTSDGERILYRKFKLDGSTKSIAYVVEQTNNKMVIGVSLIEKEKLTVKK